MWLFMLSISTCKLAFDSIREALEYLLPSSSRFKYIIWSSFERIFTSRSFNCATNSVFYCCSCSVRRCKSEFSSLYLCSKAFKCCSSFTKLWSWPFKVDISRSQSPTCYSFYFVSYYFWSSWRLRSSVRFSAFEISNSKALTCAESSSPWLVA